MNFCYSRRSLDDLSMHRVAFVMLEPACRPNFAEDEIRSAAHLCGKRPLGLRKWCWSQGRETREGGKGERVKALSSWQSLAKMRSGSELLLGRARSPWSLRCSQPLRSRRSNSQYSLGISICALTATVESRSLYSIPSYLSDKCYFLLLLFSKE